MNNLNKLKNDLEAKAQADYENNSDNYIEGEFTEEDQAVIDQMKAEQERKAAQKAAQKSSC